MTTSPKEVTAGAVALRLAFPGLSEDFTAAWFRKAAQVVLEAAKKAETDDSVCA
jgi:hypothetical protein